MLEKSSCQEMIIVPEIAILTGLEFPRSSVVDPILGGSTMTS